MIEKINEVRNEIVERLFGEKMRTMLRSAGVSEEILNAERDAFLKELDQERDLMIAEWLQDRKKKNLPIPERFREKGF